MEEFSHVSDGSVEMVDVGGKEVSYREASASGRIVLREQTVERIREDDVAKGNVFSVARVAAIQAVKETWEDVPLCHPLPIDGVEVDVSSGEGCVEVEVTVSSVGKTGVEMEALNGVTRSLLTVWDMVKSAEKDGDGQYSDTRIEGVEVEKKVKEPLPER